MNSQEIKALLLFFFTRLTVQRENEEFLGGEVKPQAVAATCAPMKRGMKPLLSVAYLHVSTVNEGPLPSPFTSRPHQHVTFQSCPP